MSTPHRRGQRIIAYTRHTPTVVPGRGNLDIPLSVWAIPDGPTLATALVSELAGAHGLAAVIGLAPAALPQPRPHGDLVVFTDHHRAAAARDDYETVEAVTRDNLANRLATMPAQLAAIIVDTRWTTAEGAWTAMTVSLANSGHVAIITGQAHPDAHCHIHNDATYQGLDYVAHIVVASPHTLDNTTSTTPQPHDPRLRHVFVYQRGGDR